MTWTRTIGLCLAGTLAATTLLAAPATARPDRGTGTALTDLVNPFIGTQNEGNTYPGAAVPFGMVQLSPDTGHATGYDYADDHIRGFSLVHLSGVGCGLGGDLPVLPTTGDVTQTDYARYAARFSHADEEARPGYYRVRLDSGIGAELTATRRTGVQRYTFPATDKANVLLNAAQSLHRNVTTKVEILDDHTVRTAITGRGFCQDTQPYTVYTLTRFDRPFTAYGTWNGSTVTDGARTGSDGAYVRFDTGEDRTVEATTALSYVDARGAAVNLRTEGGRSFDTVRDQARRTWEDRLGDVRVRGGADSLRRTFYSSLYRSFLAPNVGSDADGRYTGWDQRIHRARGFTYYQNWSLWDTYRTQSQLLSLLAPREARDMAVSVVKIDEQAGWLPKWGYGTVETNIMTGDPVTPFLTNAYQQGLLKGYEEQAYRALRKNADGVPPAASPAVGREGNREYLAHGYVPYLKDRPHAKPGDSDYDHGASATLEYALSDAMLARMARDLGHGQDADRYAARSRNYRALFDPSTGFFRARDASGAFTGPDDPAESEGFHEGTSWQYQWLVPQDLPGVVDLIGGREAARQRRPRHDVRLERPVVHRPLPGPARLRHLGPDHPGLRPRRPHPGPPLLARRPADDHRPRHLGHRPIRPVGPSRRGVLQPDLSDLRRPPVAQLAGLHRRPASLRLGHVGGRSAARARLRTAGAGGAPSPSAPVAAPGAALRVPFGKDAGSPGASRRTVTP